MVMVMILMVMVVVILNADAVVSMVMLSCRESGRRAREGDSTRKTGFLLMRKVDGHVICMIFKDDDLTIGDGSKFPADKPNGRRSWDPLTGTVAIDESIGLASHRPPPKPASANRVARPEGRGKGKGRDSPGQARRWCSSARSTWGGRFKFYWQPPPVGSSGLNCRPASCVGATNPVSSQSIGHPVSGGSPPRRRRGHGMHQRLHICASAARNFVDFRCITSIKGTRRDGSDMIGAGGVETIEGGHGEIIWWWTWLENGLILLFVWWLRWILWVLLRSDVPCCLTLISDLWIDLLSLVIKCGYYLLLLTVINWLLTLVITSACLTLVFGYWILRFSLLWILISNSLTMVVDSAHLLIWIWIFNSTYLILVI